MVPQEQRRNCRVQLGGEGTAVWSAKRRLGIEDRIGRIEIVQSAGIAVGIVFFLIAGGIGSLGYWQSLTTRE